LWAKRENAFDFFDMTNQELDEYMKIGKLIKKTLEKLFQPDMFNYATLGNVTPHLHTHIIPWYKTSRIFNGTAFVDENYGKNYAHNKSLALPEDILMQIKEAITSELEN